MELKEIQNLIKFVAKSGASEVKLEMEDIKIQEGILADIAPTMLKLMGLDVPPQMTGHSLFCRKVRDRL